MATSQTNLAPDLQRMERGIVVNTLELAEALNERANLPPAAPQMTELEWKIGALEDHLNCLKSELERANGGA